MKSFFAYIRVSTPKQGQLGVSLQEQRAAIERHAEKHGLTVSRWFEERETAAKRGRPHFSQMMKELRCGRASGVLIHKIDRSARNLKDWADLGELIDAGIDVQFATESLDLQTRGGRLSADIQAVVAADYIRNLREETRKGFYGRLKQGVYPLPAPIGYLDRGAAKPKDVDPAKAPLVRDAFELYASGAHTVRTLLDEMRRRGLRNRAGRSVSVNGMATMLNNPFYVGVIKLRRTNETFKGAHAPIVPLAVFKRVQDVLAGKYTARSQKHAFLFRRLLRCGLCGYALIGERQKGHVYYRCHTPDCATTGVREETASTVLLGLFSQVQLRPEEVAELRKLVEDMFIDDDATRDDRLGAAELLLASHKGRLDRLTDAYIDRMIEKDAFNHRRSRLLVEQAALEEQIASIRDGDDSRRAKAERILELAAAVHSSYVLANDAEKRELVEELTSNRELHGKNLVVALKSPFSEIANRGKIANGGPSRDELRTLAWEIVRLVSPPDEKTKRC